MAAFTGATPYGCDCTEGLMISVWDAMRQGSRDTLAWAVQSAARTASVQVAAEFPKAGASQVDRAVGNREEVHAHDEAMRPVESRKEEVLDDADGVDAVLGEEYEILEPEDWMCHDL